MANQTKFDKFTFETDFFETVDETCLISEEDLENAEAKGLAKGIEQGNQQALNSFNEQLETSLLPLKQQIEGFITEKSNLHKIIQEKAIIVISQTVRLLFKHLEKDLTEEALATAISQTLDGLVNDIHIVIRVNQNTYNFLEKHSAIKMLCSHKDAKLKVDDSLKAGQCTIEWEDGGAEIDLLAVSKSLEASLNDLLPQNVLSTQNKEKVEPKPVENIEKTEEQPVEQPQEKEE